MTAQPSAPHIAVVGPTGFVSGFVRPIFEAAVREGRVRQLTYISRKPMESVDPQGGAVVVKTAESPEELTKAFEGVDVAVSCLGHGAYPEYTDDILEALVKAGVKVYIPSEYGVDHYGISKYKHKVFDLKEAHFEKASKNKNLKTVRVYPGLIMEMLEYLGPQEGKPVEKVGDGNQKFAVTSGQDLAKGILETALLAYQQPDKIGDSIKFFGDMITFNDVVEKMNKMLEHPSEIMSKSLQDAQKFFEETADFSELLRILFEEGMVKDAAAPALTDFNIPWKPLALPDWLGRPRRP